MKNIILIATVFLLLACGNKKAGTETDLASGKGNSITLTAVQIKNAGLGYSSMQQKQMSSVLKVNGKIDVPPQNMVSISVPLGGYLKTTKLLPGMHVSKGEVIAVIEDQQYIQLQQDYLMARSKIGFSQLEYDRQKELNQSKASSDKVYEQSAAELSSLKITASGLSEKLKLVGINVSSVLENNISRSINIYSPINGFVSKVNVNIGKYISPTDVMFELINPADIHLALKVFEKDVDKLFIGQKLVAYSNNEPGIKHPCEILLIGKDLTSENSTDVHCHFEDYDKSLIPGTYMNAEIAVQSNNSYTLPEAAVVSFEGKQYAFVKVGEGKFEMKEVLIGNMENGFVEILNAAAVSNMTFVTQGAYSLLMALKNTSDE